MVMPRVGDVLTVRPGACPGYRAAFRARVYEVVRGGSGHPLVIGVVVINRDGRARAYRGNVVERAFDWTTDAAGLVTIDVPAPVSVAELRAAYAENAARGTRPIPRTGAGCGCVQGAVGCLTRGCIGVPPLYAPTLIPTVVGAPEWGARESWTVVFARSLRNMLRRCGHGPVVVPLVCEGLYGPGERAYTLIRVRVGPHEVTVVRYEPPVGAGAVFALYVGGQLMFPSVVGPGVYQPDTAGTVVGCVVNAALTSDADRKGE